MPQPDKKPEIRELIENRIAVLDGSMGVMIQRLGLDEKQFRGSRFMTHALNLSGNNDILVITRPDDVSAIHRAYLEVGADIIETNTFNGNRLSQKEYGTELFVPEINMKGARLAREEADRMTRLTPDRPRYVAGSIGPTGFTASISADMDNPENRSVTYEELKDAFREQAGALMDGGVDLLLIETVFDTLNAKAAIAGAKEAMKERDREIPVMVSITVSDASGRILSGQTPEAFLTTIAHFRPAAVGFNCSTGPRSLMPILKDFSEKSPFPVIFYPNAGLPDQSGDYSLTPEVFAEEMEPALKGGFVNIAGGCCGTTPEHIRRLSERAANGAVRQAMSKSLKGWLAGLEQFNDDNGFINVGERCNVAGSRKFLKLISEGNYDEAVGIARKQVSDGAMILDINMDDGMLDTRSEMVKFLRRLGNDPETARVPWMIDSSDFSVIGESLKNIQGKPIVNSISLKHGEEEFLRHAMTIKECGAAMVVMAFDENGQATDFERKTEICSRAYRLLTEKAGVDPRDIIFDPNILTVATGMAEHDRYALDFIRAVEWISKNLPGAKTSGGVSNLSFAFRGNNYIRQAMHAVFLYHAIKAGLTMAIIDPGSKVTYNDIEPELLTALEDVILCRRDDASERLSEMAARYAGVKIADVEAEKQTKNLSADEKLENALRKGDDSSLYADLEESIGIHGDAVSVIEGPLMNGMETVGKLFESGKMFLPQVVKAARTMHKAVEYLRPRMEADMKTSAKKGLFLTATVKGDVHDIGKNIVDVVLKCNNFEVIDLGVQVEASAIVEAAKKHNPDFIGLSGLITPSLREMANVAYELEKAGIRVPLFIGGAATSTLHTAVKIAPCYSGTVVRVSDAAQNPVIATRLLNDPEKESARIKAEQERIRNEAETEKTTDTAVCKKLQINWAEEPIDKPTFTGERTMPDIPLREVIPFINWTYFFNCWKVNPTGEVATELREEAVKMLVELSEGGATMQAEIGLFEAYPDEEAIIIRKNSPDGNVTEIRLDTPRQKPSPDRDTCLSLADFIAPKAYNDHIGAFAITTGKEIRQAIENARLENDDYKLLLLQSLADRLAEACSELIHFKVRTQLWRYSPEEPHDKSRIRQGKYRGIRPAVGYPSLPDQKQMHTLERLLDFSAINLEVTENGALSPASSVTGFYFASPRARYFTV